jgi:hypothetical protein
MNFKRNGLSGIIYTEDTRDGCVCVCVREREREREGEQLRSVNRLVDLMQVPGEGATRGRTGRGRAGIRLSSLRDIDNPLEVPRSVGNREDSGHAGAKLENLPQPKHTGRERASGRRDVGRQGHDTRLQSARVAEREGNRGQGGRELRGMNFPRGRSAVTRRRGNIAAAIGSLELHYAEDTWIEDLETDLSAGRLLTGKVRVNSRNVMEAFVSIPGHSRDIFLDGIGARFPAFDGDEIALRLCSNGSRSAGAESLEVLTCATVVMVTKAGHKEELCGHVELERPQPEDRNSFRAECDRQLWWKPCVAPDTWVHFVPHDARYLPMLVRLAEVPPALRDAGAAVCRRMLLLARIDSWPPGQSIPCCTLVRQVGPVELLHCSSLGAALH